MEISPPRLKIFDRELDYPRVAPWWVARGWDAVPLERIPGLAVISYFERSDFTWHYAAFACLYMDNSGSGICMLEWLVTNPANSDRESLRAIKAAVEFLEAEAVRLNYSVMMTASSQPSLCRLHEKSGFIKTDSGMTHFVKPLR